MKLTVNTTDACINTGFFPGRIPEIFVFGNDLKVDVRTGNLVTGDGFNTDQELAQLAQHTPGQIGLVNTNYAYNESGKPVYTGDIVGSTETSDSTSDQNTATVVNDGLEERDRHAQDLQAGHEDRRTNDRMEGLYLDDDLDEQGTSDKLIDTSNAIEYGSEEYFSKMYESGLLDANSLQDEFDFMNQLFIGEMEGKIGTPYVSGGGNISSNNGKSTVDENGNYLGYDCVGGIMDSLRNVTGFDIPAMEQNGLINQPWLDVVDSNDQSLVFVNNLNKTNKEWEHVLVYDDETAFTTGTRYGNHGGYAEINIDIAKSFYNNNHTRLQFRQINWQKLYDTYK